MTKTLSVYLKNGNVSVSTTHERSIGWRSGAGIIVVVVDGVEHGRFSVNEVAGVCIDDKPLVQDKIKLKAE